MLAFAGQRSNAGVAKGGIENRISDVRDNKSRSGTKASPSRKRHNARVRHIRQQLADGKYNVDMRVNGVLDKLLEVLIA